MLFWILAAGMALSVAILFAKALHHPRPNQQAGGAALDLDVYRAQLRDVDRDIARGVLAADQAERLRLEISRRILQADDQSQRAPSAQTAPVSPLWAAAIAIALCAISLAVYQQLGAPAYPDQPLEARKAEAEERRANRPSQAAFEASLPPAAPLEVSAEYQALVDQLRRAVQTRPDDLQGHQLLARNEANLGNYAAAARALAAIVRIKGPQATATDLVDQADMMVIAAGGFVSPEAEQTLSQALALDPGNGTARYYMGLSMAQTGRPDIAFRIWNPLLKDSAPNDPWVAPIRAQIEQIARLAGADYTPPTNGPSAEDILAADDLTAPERRAMIDTMVANLAEDLAIQGGAVEKWAQLINALSVLNRTDEARDILANARLAFAGDAAALAILNRTATQAGLSE